MSVLKIQRLLEVQLATVNPNISTSFENTAFKPVEGTPYQRINHLRTPPENPEMTGTFVREGGLMQVTLMYPLGPGAKNALTQAELIKAKFPRGSQFTGNGVTVTIERTPYVMAGSVDGDRWSVPVRIPYYANI
jgi:hypothetical protein